MKVGGHYSSGGLWGYIDRKGVEVIKPKYDWTHPFHEGLAAVKVGEKWGFVDARGTLVIPARYKAVGRFSEGLAAVQDDALWGFIGTDGEYRIRPRFDAAGEFRGGLAAACEPVKEGLKRFYGCIDRSGAFVLKPQFDYVAAYQEGLAAFSRDDKWGFIDRTGKVVVEPIYGRFAQFHEGRARVGLQTRARGGKNSGRTVTRSAFIAPDGRELTPFQPDYDTGLEIDSNGTLSALEIHPSGDETRVGTIDFDRLQPQHGLYRVSTPQTLRTMTYHKYGFVDRTGRVVIPPTLESVGDFHEGLAAYATGLDWDLVERSNQQNR